VGEVTTATTCNHSKKHNFNHLSVHQWIRSAVRGSQQPTSYRFPIFETSATALCGTTGKLSEVTAYVAFLSNSLNSKKEVSYATLIASH
jgi:hypothetical protein